MGGSSKTVVGHKYFLGMHMVICHGPVDELQKIIVGEREAWSGSATASSSITIDKPDLFGGIDKEGGVQGTVDVMMGEATQPKNPYLMSKLGSVIPAFRGVLSVVLNKVYVCAMSQYPKPWAFKVKRIPARSWYPEKADIGGSANIAHVIYETLTNKDWGMGYPISVIDDAAFRSVADTLYSESLGVSVLLMQQDTIENFIYQMVGHCNGMLYTRPDNGKFSLKLLREDYDVDTLPLFNESNILRLESFEKPQYAEMVNEVVVTYHPRGSLNDDSVTVHSLASIQAQGAVISASSSYPGIDTAENAARCAMRDLRQKSTPLTRLKMSVNRKAWNLVLGDVFKFSWTEHKVSGMVFRVFGVNYGTIDAGEIIIDAVEDIFGFPTSTYIVDQPSQWIDPIQPPAPLANYRVENTPYYFLNYLIPATDFEILNQSDAYSMLLAGEPAQYLQGVELWSSPASTYEFATVGELCGTAILQADVPLSGSSTVIQLSNFSAKAPLAQSNSYAYLNGEIVRVISIDLTAQTVTVGRGCLDTIPQAHSAGSLIWFAEDAVLLDPVLRAPGATMHYKLLPKSSSQTLDISAAPQLNLLLNARHWKPYAPGNVKINSLSYPARIFSKPVLTWAHRDRTQQLTVPMLDHTAGSVGPETGVQYVVDILNEVGTNVLHTSTTSTTVTLDNEISVTLTDYATDRSLRSQGAVSLTSTLSQNLAPTQWSRWFAKVNGGYLSANSAATNVENDLRFVDGSTGTLIERDISPLWTGPSAGWLNVAGFDKKTGIVVLDPYWENYNNSSYVGNAIYFDNAGVMDQNIVKPTLNDMPFLDRRSNPENIFMVSFGNVLIGLSTQTFRDIKSLRMAVFQIVTVNRSNVISGSAAITVTEVDRYILGDPAALNSLTGLSNAAPYVTPVNLKDTTNPTISVIYGSLVYIHYPAPDATYSSSGKLFDVTNLLNSHVTVGTTLRDITRRFTISGATLTPLDVRAGVILADQLNATQGVEVHVAPKTVKIVNSTSGAFVSDLGTLGYTPVYLCCDSVNEYIYIISSTGTLYKYSNTLALLASIVIDTIAILGDCLLKESAGYLYVTTRSSNTVRVSKTLANYSIVNGLKLPFPGYSDPSSSVLMMYDTATGSGLGTYGLVDENGIASSTFNQATQRVSDEYTIELSSTRSGVDSLSKYQIITPRCGYGLRYGEYYGE